MSSRPQSGVPDQARSWASFPLSPGERGPGGEVSSGDHVPPSSTSTTWHDADDLRWATRHWATRIGVKAPLVIIRDMRTKWASISTSGRLTLNRELLALPRRLGEFVVVHELLHLIAPNHGRLHKTFLSAYLPDWEQRQRDLAAVNARRRDRHRPPTHGS